MTSDRGPGTGDRRADRPPPPDAPDGFVFALAVALVVGVGRYLLGVYGLALVVSR